MKSVKFKILLVLVVLSSMLSGTAHATSSYDHVISTVDRLEIVGLPNAALCKIDLSHSWADDFRTFLSGDDLASFDNRVAWSVSVAYADDGYGILPTSIFIYWWELDDLPNEATFTSRVSGSITYDQLVAPRPTGAGTLEVSWGDCSLIGGALSLSSTNISIATYSSATPVYPPHRDRPFVLYGFDVDYPVGYEGEFIPAEPPLAKYVALGDSFSSGEGVPPFEYGTDTTTNQCHRSSQAYPRLLQNDPSLDLGPTDFVACSGATTSDVINGKYGEAPQIDALSAETEVVTITVGGNDVGFGEYAHACVVTTCGENTFDYNYIMNAIQDADFQADLVDTYEAILTNAPNAEVYVGGYPYLASEASEVCGLVDISGAWNVQTALNQVIVDAVNESNDSRLYYVPTNYTGSPFAGKHLCNGGDSYFNGLVGWPNLEHSFHPNADGQEAYKVVFENAIS